MSTINQSYFDRVRFILQNSEIGSLIIEEPIGWDSDDKELSRHKEYHGIFANFSNNLKFVGKSKDYIETIYEIYGVNAQIRLIKEEKHPKTDLWIRSYDGYLNMSTRTVEENAISLKFSSGGLEAELKARESEDVEITRNTTLDGKSLSNLAINNVEIDGREIFLQTDYEVKPTDNHVYMETWSDDGNVRSKVAPIPLKLVNQSHEEAHSILEESQHEGIGTTGAMFFAVSERNRTLKLKYKIKFTFNIVAFEYVDWSEFHLRLTKYTNGIDYVPIESIDLISFGPAGWAQHGSTFEKEDILNIDLLPGQSLGFEFFILADFKNPLTHRQRFYVDLTNIESTLRLEEDSFVEKSISNCILPHEVAERLIEIYTNKKALKSNVLGRTDIGYQEDGKASLIGLTHGFWIRGFDSMPIGTEDNPNLFKPLSTSLKDFIQSFSAVHNLGLGIESDGFKEYVRIEELGYFYNRTTTIKLPNQVKKVKRTEAVDYYYSSLELGYEKGGDYEEAFGLVEYNGMSKFSSIIKVLRNSYSKLSKFRADSYGIEFARRKPKLSHGTEDTRYDTDIFLLDMKRNSLSNTFKLRKWQDDFTNAPTGTFSPDTAYNLRLSPFNCLLRHGWVIASGLTKYLSDYIRFTSSTANSSLSTKLIGGNEYSENGNIINSELLRPRYVPEFIEFEHEVSFDINQQLYGSKMIFGKKIPNMYGCVEFTNERGEQEKGFLINLKPNGAGQWKLLKAY